MASSAGDREPDPGRQAGAGENVHTFDTTAPSEPAEATEDERPTRALTVAAVLAALGLTALTLYLTYDLAGMPGVAEFLLVTILALVIGLGGMLPMRWGFYMVPFVAGSHYALNFYNLIVTEESVYGFVPGDAYGYALFTPLIGVVLGFLLQGLYSAIVEA